MAVKGDLGARVGVVLRSRLGRRRAIRALQLSRVVGASEREVRGAVSELVAGGALIGASVDGECGGYYMIETLEELEETRGVLRARAMAILERDRALVASWRAVHGPGVQLEFWGLESCG